MDDDGYLTITGRKKDLLVTAGGKNVAPGPLEDALREHRLVSQALVVGEGRPFIAALVSLDEEGLAGWLAAAGRGPMDLLRQRPKIPRCGPSCSKPWTTPTGWSRGRSRSGSSTFCGRT